MTMVETYSLWVAMQFGVTPNWLGTTPGQHGWEQRLCVPLELKHLILEAPLIHDSLWFFICFGFKLAQFLVEFVQEWQRWSRIGLSSTFVVTPVHVASDPEQCRVALSSRVAKLKGITVKMTVGPKDQRTVKLKTNVAVGE